MASLKELQNLYLQVCEEERDYWQELRNTLKDVHRSFAFLLELNPENPILMSIGVINPEGKFIHTDIDQLPKTDRSLEFTLQVILAQVKTEVPPNLISTSWSIRGAREGVALNEKGGRDKLFDSPDDSAKFIARVFKEKISKFSPYVW